MDVSTLPKWKGHLQEWKRSEVPALHLRIQRGEADAKQLGGEGGESWRARARAFVALLLGPKAILRALLAEHLPDWRPCNTTLPSGGLSMWMRLPAPMSSALSAAASRLGVDIPPGPRFGVDGTLERYLRVPYALPDDQLAEAIPLLARAWAQITGAGPAPMSTTPVAAPVV